MAERDDSQKSGLDKLGLSEEQQEQLRKDALDMRIPVQQFSEVTEKLTLLKGLVD